MVLNFHGSLIREFFLTVDDYNMHERQVRS